LENTPIDEFVFPLPDPILWTLNECKDNGEKWNNLHNFMKGRWWWMKKWMMEKKRLVWLFAVVFIGVLLFFVAGTIGKLRSLFGGDRLGEVKKKVIGSGIDNKVLT